MREAGLSTRGLEAGQTALAAREEPPLPPALEGRALFLAGFVRLTASEDMLFRYLWERGAHICLHSDPGVIRGGGHWSCADHRDWIRAWNAGAELVCPPSGNVPDIRFSPATISIPSWRSWPVCWKTIPERSGGVMSGGKRSVRRKRRHGTWKAGPWCCLIPPCSCRYCSICPNVN